MDMMVEYVFLRGKLHTVVTFDNTSKTRIVKSFDFDNDGNVISGMSLRA